MPPPLLLRILIVRVAVFLLISILMMGSFSSPGMMMSVEKPVSQGMMLFSEGPSSETFSSERMSDSVMAPMSDSAMSSMAEGHCDDNHHQMPMDHDKGLSDCEQLCAMLSCPGNTHLTADLGDLWPENRHILPVWLSHLQLQSRSEAPYRPPITG